MVFIIKCEKYARRLRAEICFINFAPLSEGRYVTAFSDGKTRIITDGKEFDGETDLSLAQGFFALIFYVNKTVLPIAVASCGNFPNEMQKLSLFVQEEEKLKSPEELIKKEKAADYDDDAIAEDNYYERGEDIKNGNALLQNKTQKKGWQSGNEDEKVIGAEQEQTKNVEKEEVSRETLKSAWAQGKAFYEQVKGEIDEVFDKYPEEKSLCAVVDNSRWVKINYGDKKYYVFGVIYEGDIPQYICYGVPSNDEKKPPKSLTGRASFIPSNKEGNGGGFWVMFQDALTGAAVDIEQV